MDSDEERNNEIQIYQQLFYQEGKEVDKTSSNKAEITIGIFGWETRGSGLKKHTAYRIKGTDRNGTFEVWRRFNQFHQMRICMVRAWPGCLVPSLPSKNPLTKNQEQISRRRSRYLNDFLKKMAMRPFLYYSDQFQALLRSLESNLSDTFSKWSPPTTEQIINRYRLNFGTLAGREITNNTIEQIFHFHSWLEHNQKLLIEYRKNAKELAFQRDRLNKYYLQFFKTARNYEDSIMSTYTEPRSLIYANPEASKYQEHQEFMAKILQGNPYWLLYDLIKNEERDGRAFAELIKSIEQYAEKTREVEGKIETNVKGISGTTAGKVTIKTIGMKGTPQEIKYQLQMENESLKKEKEASQTLRDIIVALVCYIEIREYKAAKKQFYEYIIKRLATYQEQFVVVASKVWEDLQAAIEQLADKIQ